MWELDLALILQIICVRASVGTIDNLAYFFHNLTLSAKYSYGWDILNPVESIPVNMCLIPVKRIKDEINFFNHLDVDSICKFL